MRGARYSFSRPALVVALVAAAAAARGVSAGKYRQSPCTEPVDEQGNTCSDYKTLSGETNCEELMDLIDGEVFNGETLHCQCACPEYYEPVPAANDGCDDFTVNKKCPEAFDEDVFDYHPLGDGDEDDCLKLCSNMPAAVCCFMRPSDDTCWSHRLGASTEFSGRIDGKAALCNIECEEEFDITLLDDGRDGWGNYALQIQTFETNTVLSDKIKHLAADYYKSDHSLCVRESTPCYQAVIVSTGSTDEDQAAQIHFEISKDGNLLASGNSTHFPGFGLSSGHACPSRLFKRLGRYSLKQFEKVAQESMPAAKAYRNIGRKADSLGLFVRPVKKMGAVWPLSADWVPTTTTTTNPFGITATTTDPPTTSTTTQGSDLSVLITGGATTCKEYGHCAITDMDMCNAEAAKWGLSDTVSSSIDRGTKPPGCQLIGSGVLQFNIRSESTAIAASDTTLICELCTSTTTTTTTTTTSTTTTTTTTPKPTTEELVRTAAPTTEEQGRVITTESPYEVIPSGFCYQYELCRVADATSCDAAAKSLGTSRSADVSRTAKPGGCLQWTDGRFKFNDVLDSGVESSQDEGFQVVCYECADFQAPAPDFTRKITTEEATRPDATTEEARDFTTEEVVTRKVTTEEVTNRYYEYVTKAAGSEPCRPEYCALSTEEECNAAAVALGLADTKSGTESASNRVAGCYMNKFDVLKFNTLFYLDDGEEIRNLNPGRDDDTHVCMTCAPAPAPKRETTEVATRGDGTTKARTDPQTTEIERTTTTGGDRNIFTYYREDGTTEEIIVNTERPATTTERGGNYDSATTTVETTTTVRGGGGGGSRTTTLQPRTTTEGRTDDRGDDRDTTLRDDSDTGRGDDSSTDTGRGDDSTDTGRGDDSSSSRSDTGRGDDSSSRGDGSSSSSDTRDSGRDSSDTRSGSSGSTTGRDDAATTSTVRTTTTR